jgi:hypothetical protein
VAASIAVIRVAGRQSVGVAVVGLVTVVALIVFVLASATVDVPSEVSLPLILLATLAFRSFKNRGGRVAQGATVLRKSDRHCPKCIVQPSTVGYFSLRR